MLLNLYKIWAFGYPFEASERAVIKKGKDSFYVMSAHKQIKISKYCFLIGPGPGSNLIFDFLLGMMRKKILLNLALL